jgi:hypothetical protein
MPPALPRSISKLYMGGTCTSERNNMGSGCSSNSSGTVIPHTYSFSVDPAVCLSVFADGPSSALLTLNPPSECRISSLKCADCGSNGAACGDSWWESSHLPQRVPSEGGVQSTSTHPPTHPPTAGEGTFDSGSLCAKTEQGFVFLLNSCNQTGTAVDVDLTIDVAQSGCPAIASGPASLSGPASVSGTARFPDWAILVLAVGISFGLPFVCCALACICNGCKPRKQEVPPVLAGSTAQLTPRAGMSWTAPGAVAPAGPPLAYHLPYSTSTMTYSTFGDAGCSAGDGGCGGGGGGGGGGGA